MRRLLRSDPSDMQRAKQNFTTAEWAGSLAQDVSLAFGVVVAVAGARCLKSARSRLTAADCAKLGPGGGSPQ